MQDLLTNPLLVFIPLGLIFYFLVLRPQQQQQKEHRTAIDNLRRGDTVVTAGGLVGRVAKAPTKDDPFGRNDGKTLRMWTDASGKYRIEARFVSFTDGTVRLQKANGRYVRVQYDLLSTADRGYVRRQDATLFAAE